LVFWYFGVWHSGVLVSSYFDIALMAAGGELAGLSNFAGLRGTTKARRPTAFAVEAAFTFERV
jgi:hypothetical protein